jgi:predicted transcriptional regulator
MNNELYGKKYEIPENVLNSLENHKDETTIKNIFTNGYLTYQNMKKILHDIDNNKFQGKDLSSLKSFITQNLGSDRGSVNRQKRDASDSGMQNQYLSAHKKNDPRNITDKPHSKLYENNKEVVESLKRINEIMRQIL